MSMFSSKTTALEIGPQDDETLIDVFKTVHICGN